MQHRSYISHRMRTQIWTHMVKNDKEVVENVDSNKTYDEDDETDLCFNKWLK